MQSFDWLMPRSETRTRSAISDVALVSMRYGRVSTAIEDLSFVRGYRPAECTRMQINTGFGNSRRAKMAVGEDDEERILSVELFPNNCYLTMVYKILNRANLR